MDNNGADYKSDRPFLRIHAHGDSGWTVWTQWTVSRSATG